MNTLSEPQKLSKLLHFSVRDKLMVVSLLTVTLAIAVSGWLILERQRAYAAAEIVKRVPEFARIVGTALTNSLLGFDYQAIQQVLDDTVLADGIIHLRVENAKGVTMAEAGARPHSEQDLVIVRHPIRYEGVSVGNLEIVASTRVAAERLEHEFRYFTSNLVLIIVFLFVVEFMAIAWLVNRPLRRLTATLHVGINERGEVIPPLGPYGNDEFGELQAQFASLCETLNASSRNVQSQMVVADQRLLEANHKLMRQALELKIKNEELQALSLTDPLTGLYNRRQFENFIEAELSLALRHGEDLSLLMLDIDQFKQVNDNYGHSAGDHVLKQVAVIMRNVVRKSDVLCRIGGEEFVVLGKHLKRIDALGVAEKIRVAVEKAEHEVDGQRFCVTVSIGVVSVPSPVEIRTALDFFKYADQALYYCKQNGRNQVTHFQDIVPQVRLDQLESPRNPDTVRPPI